VAVTVLAGCDDKATPDYKKCLEREAQGSLEAARESCLAAANTDPSSKDGIAAGSELTKIDTKIREAKDKKDKEAQEQRKKQEKTDEANCTSGRWVTNCQIGDRWSGLQTFKSKLDCDTAFVDLPGSTCNPCKCMP
jgi:hypothetical protein